MLIWGKSTIAAALGLETARYWVEPTTKSGHCRPVWNHQGSVPRIERMEHP